MTVPGVGPITALSFKAAIDDPHRFRRSRNVGAHFGLTPRRHQSGTIDWSGHVTKMGDVSMRGALCEGCPRSLVQTQHKQTIAALPPRGWTLRRARTRTRLNSIK